MNKMKKSDLDKLLAIYDAIGGLVSESSDPFDQMYVGGTDKLIDDFESVLVNCGVKFAERIPGQYYIVSYMGFTGKEWAKLGVKPRKEWGICTDKNHPDQSWCLTGMTSPEQALEVIKNPAIFKDYNGEPVEVIDAVA